MAGMLQAAGCRLLAVACWLQAAGCRQFAAGRWPVLVGTCAHCCAVLSVTPLFSWCVVPQMDSSLLESIHAMRNEAYN